MAIILCLETTTTNCSVALTKDGIILAIKESNSRNFSHAEKLHVFINQILEENDLLPSQLNAVAISKGPGSYTGLRIGVSSAKGLCFALGIPLISIDTMLSLAMQVKSSKGVIIPMLDARRMEVYVAGFHSDFRGIFPTRAQILEENSFEEFLNAKKTFFIGTGVEKFKNICRHPNAVFIEEKFPTAREMASLAVGKYQDKNFEDAAYFEPFYLKDFMVG